MYPRTTLSAVTATWLAYLVHAGSSPGSPLLEPPWRSIIPVLLGVAVLLAAGWVVCRGIEERLEHIEALEREHTTPESEVDAQILASVTRLQRRLDGGPRP